MRRKGAQGGFRESYAESDGGGTCEHALAAEELLTHRPDGVVIARCADGDRVLLLVDGTVIRFSHESPESVDRWPGLSQFMADAMADGE